MGAIQCGDDELAPAPKAAEAAEPVAALNPGRVYDYQAQGL